VMSVRFWHNYLLFSNTFNGHFKPGNFCYFIWFRSSAAYSIHKFEECTTSSCGVISFGRGWNKELSQWESCVLAVLCINSISFSSTSSQQRR
jgi:hypothetical protein